MGNAADPELTIKQIDVGIVASYLDFGTELAVREEDRGVDRAEKLALIEKQLIARPHVGIL
jgi:hypothetical protein